MNLQFIRERSWKFIIVHNNSQSFVIVHERRMNANERSQSFEKEGNFFRYHLSLSITCIYWSLELFYNFKFWILNFKNIFKSFKKLFSSFPNDFERSFAFIRERSWTIMNDYERSWTFTNELKVHEGSWTIFTNKNVGNFWMTRIVLWNYLVSLTKRWNNSVKWFEFSV